MTSSEIPSRIAMKVPFANSQTDYTIGDDSTSTVNYPEGFSSVYSLPASNGGKYVSRADINSLGKLATNDLFCYKCGVLNTFDEAFCDKIGGYPLGAVLDYNDGTNCNKVISLVENNTFNYMTSGVDGVNWMLLNAPTVITSSGYKLCSINNPEPKWNITPANAVASPIGIFTAGRAGVLTAIIEGTKKYLLGAGDTTHAQGLAVIVSDLGSTGTTFPTIPSLSNIGTSTDWKMIYTDGIGIHPGDSGSATYYGTQATVNTTVGNKYAVAFYLFGLSSATVEDPDEMDSIDITSLTVNIV